MMKSLSAFSFLLLLACNHSETKNSNTSLNNNDSLQIHEKEFINLGGEKQYVEINGESKNNPVLLFLHGGPGWPQTPHLRYFNAALTQKMTVVAWEQSGCGKSFMNNPNPKILSLDQIINDAHQLTQLLKKKFNTDRIYLAGFSWGSIPGLILAEKYPEDYEAYFGITQVINLRNSMHESAKWIKMQAVKTHDEETLKQLHQIQNKDSNACKRELDCFIAQYGLLNKYGGAIYSKDAENEISKAETFYDDYKKYDWFKAFYYSAYRLENDLFNTNLSNIVHINIPVYFMMGKHDWNIPTSITEEYFRKLKAPKKEIIWFNNSGHEPLSEEASEFNKEMINHIHH